MFGMRMFENDPFFDIHQAHMDRMNNMFQNPFFQGGFGPGPFMAVTGGQEGQREQQRDRQRRGQRSSNTDLMARDPFSGVMGGDIFSSMNGMMQNMNGMFANVHRQMGQVQNDQNSNFYSQSTVMSYTNDGRGPPKVYQASTATRQAPGGVRETRRMVRDTERGIEKMAVGHHLGPKGHVITKKRDLRSGELEENRDLENLSEDEAEQFEEEWKQHATNQRVSNTGRGLPAPPQHRRDRYPPNRQAPAITYKRHKAE